MIRLIAVDIDGTLLDSTGRIPDAHRRALEEAVGAGLTLVLVTGRTFHYSRPVADALGLPLTLIVNNGAAVKTRDGSTVMRRVLPRDLVLDLLDRTTTYDDCVALVFDREPGEDEHRQTVFDRMDWTHPHRSGYYERNKEFIALAAPLQAALTEDPIQVMFNGRVGQMRTLAATLRGLPRAAEFSVAVTEYERRDFSLVDVNAAGCSKGATLARWARVGGFGPADVLAVGDNLNDLEMLEFAGTPVVMGNAVDQLKGRGFHTTASHDEGGLAEAIRRFAPVL
jgi:Cof subfamily protein (haloacid dehalogenase superfamily)